MRKSAFTMIELVFVIVILGILASIAVPRFGATRTDALISKGRSDIAAIRAGISYVRSVNILKGESGYPPLLEPNTEMNNLFFFSDNNSSNIIEHVVRSGSASGEWSKDNNTTYQFHIGAESIQFNYNYQNGTFDCSSGSYCDELSGR